jgi:hypothetical protein
MGLRARDCPGPADHQPWRDAAYAPLACALALVLCSCDTPPTARAYRVEDRVQLVGGPSAIGEIGDYVIENDRIRTVVLQGGNSVGPGLFGGTVVDVDLRRPEREHSAGRGLDQFAELFPMVNLVIPGYQDAQSYGIGDLDVEVWAAGGDGRCPLSEEEAPEGCAAIRVAGRGDRIIEALGTVELLQVPMDLSFVTYYVLRPGDRYLLVRTFFWDDNRWSPDRSGLEPGSDEEPARLAELALRPTPDGAYAPLDDAVPIFDALVGDALAEDPADVSPYRHPGYLAGDFLMLGKSAEPFATSTLAAGPASDRSGFEISTLFQRRYDRGEVVLAHPLANSLVVGVGDRVSYGYFSAAGTVVVPILTGSFTGAFTHGFQCVTATNREDCDDELARPLVYDRYLVVGDGDAASVLEVYYDMTGTPTGRVSGHVFDEQSGQPIEGARVFALIDPRDRVPDADVTSYESALAALRGIDWNEDGRPDRNPSLMTFAAVDPGIDRVADASWSMRLEPGRYLLVPFVYGREAGRPVPLDIEEGEEAEVSLALPPAARLLYEIIDERGEPTTAKLTLIGPLADEVECPSEREVPELSSLRYLELGMSERPQGIALVVYSQTGSGTVEVAPGRYDVIASKGFEHSIDRRCLFLRHDTTLIEQFSVLREVDTTGWVAGDFHVHGINSYDATVTHRDRIVTAAAEGIEVFAATDHDYLTNLVPAMYDLGMRDDVTPMVGLEVTPIELGHVLGYPLRFDETAEDNGAIDWSRRDECLVADDAFGCPASPGGFMGLTGQEIFDRIRDLGEFGPEHTVVTLPHPRDGFFGFFDQYSLNQFDLRLDPPGLVRGQNPLLATYDAIPNERFRLYSENFDAIELFNGLRYEFIRTPTVSEVTSFVSDIEAARRDAVSEQDYANRMARVHDTAMRRILVRTPREQGVLRYGRVLGCQSHDDCADGQMCDPHRDVCTAEMPSCETAEDCLEACVERGRCSVSGAVCTGDDDCAAGTGTCETSRECATSARPCTSAADCFTTCTDGECRPEVFACAEDDDCPRSHACDDATGTCQPGRPACDPALPCPRGYVCESGVRTGATGGRCLLQCQGDDECQIDEYCDLATGACIAAACNIDPDGHPMADGPEDGDRPCTRNRSLHVSGVVDDWFRLLNYGVAYTAMGNSDTHTMSSEIGLPRNFVMSSVDAPGMIDRREIADSIRAFHVVTSFGPFIEVSAEGGVIGDTVAAEGPVELHVRVQSASWIDVDRIEVYGNGELVCDLGVASTAATRCDTPAELALDAEGHDTDIVNFDGVINLGELDVDTWFVVIAMGVSENARGLTPVYFAAMHPQLGFSEVIGQAFASFDVALLRAVIPPPVPRVELNAIIPYAVTNPIWIESDRDDDDVWTAPLGIPPYRRDIPCQFAREPVGCRDVEVMPFSAESLGQDRNPVISPEEEQDAESVRLHRIHMIQQALVRLAGGGH